MNEGIENCPILFKNESIPTLLAICEFVSEKVGSGVTPKTMILTIDLLEGLLYIGKRQKKPGSKWGCKGRPKGEQNGRDL